MAQDILNLQEESFERIIKTLSQHLLLTREQYDRAVDKVTALSSEWNDEDYQNLLEAIKGIGVKLDIVDEHTQQAIAKAEYKLEMIHARKNIKL